MTGASWAEAVFRASVLKQQKWHAIRALLGPTRGLRCLDIGADNGIISLLLRRQGGSWVSADLDGGSVEAIRGLVGGEVHLVNGGRMPFAAESFDRVVVVDALEHLHDDRGFIEEMARILRPGGVLLVNVPHLRETWLRRMRIRIGQTDERHGHVRPGYSEQELREVVRGRFAVTEARTYSRFFSEAIDTAIRWAQEQVAGRGVHGSVKGSVVTEDVLSRHGRLFALYRALAPLVWLVSQLDALLVGRSGYRLIVRAVRVSLPDATARTSACTAQAGA
jgi:SAM-dependent methyltransferase